jgi:hypothetical protein
VFNITSGRAPTRTLYLGGSAPVSVLVTAVNIAWQDNDDAATRDVMSFSAANRSITLTQGAAATGTGSTRPGFHSFTSASLPAIRFGLVLCGPDGGSSWDFLRTIILTQQQYSTLGVVPVIRNNDIDVAEWFLATEEGQPPLVTRRRFSTFAPVGVGAIVREELKLAGCFLSVNASGQLLPKRLRLPAQSELADTATIDESTLLTDRTKISHEVAGLGQINQVLLRTGYNPQEDEYTGRTWITRDVAAYGKSPSVRQMKIEPKSEYIGPAITENEVIQAASAIFGCFAGSYAIDTIDVAMHDDTLVGDAIVFDHPYYPSGEGDSLGVTGKVGLVIGKKTEAMSPRATFTVLTTRQKLGGYAPAADVTDATDLGGNDWVVTIDSSLFPSGTALIDWFANGDRVRLIEANTASATVVVGTVIDNNYGTFDIEVQFDGVWGGPASGTGWWYLTMADSDDASLAATQRRFCSIAGSTSIVDYPSDDAPAFRFGA